MVQDIDTSPVPVMWEGIKQVSLVRALKAVDIPRRDVVARFGTWVVTQYGVECLATYYPIEAHRLWKGETDGYTWERHLREKTWVRMEDVKAALAYGRRYHQTTLPEAPGSQSDGVQGFA